MKRTFRKKVYQYTAIFEPDIESGGYTVTVPTLPGCISEGDTFEQALKNIQEACSLYLEVMRDQKELIKDEKGIIIAPVQVTI
jgi:predicted RNase H-like HicB family nuclease